MYSFRFLFYTSGGYFMYVPERLIRARPVNRRENRGADDEKTWPVTFFYLQSFIARTGEAFRTFCDFYERCAAQRPKMTDIFLFNLSMTFFFFKISNLSILNQFSWSGVYPDPRIQFDYKIKIKHFFFFFFSYFSLNPVNFHWELRKTHTVYKNTVDDF